MHVSSCSCACPGGRQQYNGRVLLSCAVADPPLVHSSGVGSHCDIPYWRLPDINCRDRLRRGSIFDGCRRWTGIVREAFAVRTFRGKFARGRCCAGLCTLGNFGKVNFPGRLMHVTEPEASRKAFHSLSPCKAARQPRLQVSIELAERASPASPGTALRFTFTDFRLIVYDAPLKEQLCAQSWPTTRRTKTKTPSSRSTAPRSSRRVCRPRRSTFVIPHAHRGLLC